MTNKTTFTCDTCYDTGLIDHGGREINCPDCPVEESLELMAVTTIWANPSGREFTRTKSYRAAWVADAIDMASSDLPDTASDILDQWMA